MVIALLKDKGNGNFGIYTGLSTDAKPECGNGSCFYEMDTKKFMYYDGRNSVWRAGVKSPVFDEYFI